MKASDLINNIQNLVKKHGDLDIKIHNPYGESIEDDFEEINIAHIFPEDLDVDGYFGECFVIEGF